MQLMTIADLNQPVEHRNELIRHAMQLGSLHSQWRAQAEGFDIHAVKKPGTSRDPGLHASEMSGCQRRLVYALRNEKKQEDSAATDVNMLRRFDIGTLVHELLQYEFLQTCQWLNGAITFEPEVRIHPGLGGMAEKYNAHSSMDGLFTFWHHGIPYLRVALEIKTKSHPEYTKMTAPDEAHMEQLCFYMTAHDIPVGWVLYYNKSSSQMTPSLAPYLFTYDANLWNAVLEPRIVSGYEMAASGNLPERTEGRQCGWCPYAHTCQPSYLVTGRAPQPTITRKGGI